MIVRYGIALDDDPAGAFTPASSPPPSCCVTRKQVLDELQGSKRGTISLFLSLVGVEGHDGKPLTVEEAWEIARVYEKTGGAK